MLRCSIGSDTQSTTSYLNSCIYLRFSLFVSNFIFNIAIYFCIVDCHLSLNEGCIQYSQHTTQNIDKKHKDGGIDSYILLILV